MRSRTWMRAFALLGVVGLTAPYTAAFAQQVVTIADVLNGKSVPLSFKVADLPGDYKPVHIKVSGSGGGGFFDMLMGMLGPFAMMGGSSPKDQDSAAFMAVIDLSWTKGDVVKVQGKDFLVTYKWSIEPRDLMTQTANNSTDSKANPLADTPLSLALVAVDNIAAISPANGVTKEDLIKVQTMKMHSDAEAAAAGTAPTEVAHDAPAAEAATPDDQGLSHAKQLGMALQIYAQDYDDVLPYAQGTKAVQFVTYPYVKNIDVWKTMNPNGSDFRFNIAVGGSSLPAIDLPAETVMFFESKPWPDGTRLVTFLDGHARRVTHDEWPTVEASMKKSYPKVAKPLPLSYGMDWNPGGAFPMLLSGR
ncbi:MAG: hypothetical protein JSS66_03105 [Armatimonadetes bacterium]|nr:hypothetical protein [Armatimonadota bacterium]